MSKLTEAMGRQVLRGYILYICEKAEPSGAGLEVISGAIKKEGLHYSREDIQEACAYLESKGLIQVTEVSSQVLGISRHIAKITARGIDLLEGTIEEQGIELI